MNVRSKKGSAIEHKSNSRDMLTVDEQQAFRVLSSVYSAYLERQAIYGHVFRNEHAPQWLYLPEGMQRGSEAHQWYLYFLTATDRMGVSDEIHRGHRELWGKFPHLYTSTVLSVDVQSLSALVREHKIGLPEKTAGNWLVIARTLFESFQGDPALIYEDGSIDAIIRKKNARSTRDRWRLPGFGPKVLSLLALFCAEMNVMPMPSDAFPVDVHAQRLAISTGIVSGSGFFRNETIEQVLRPLFCRIAAENQWSVIDLAHATFFLGNRLCTRCCRTKSAPLLCPTYNVCQGAISTKSYGLGLWNLDEPLYRKGGDMTLRLRGGVHDGDGRQQFLWS